MGLDIRLPLGMLFSVVGALLTGFGFVTRHSSMYATSEGANLNLWWGLGMLLFGLVMFYFGRGARWEDDPMNPRPWER